MNSKPIWVPKNNKTLLDDYLTFLKKKNLKSYNKLWSWSVNNKEKFWESIWKFSKVKGVGLWTLTAGHEYLGTARPVLGKEFAALRDHIRNFDFDVKSVSGNVDGRR